MWTRKYKLGEEPRIDHVERAMTPGERIALVWEITKNVWSIDDEARIRRDITRVIRPPI
jgi:predicted AAA+ superfamily ATPase